MKHLNPSKLSEEERLDALYSQDLLDTRAEPLFDELTALARASFDVPICLISLVDRDRQWFKSCIGLSVTETPRDISFCKDAILQSGLHVVSNASADPAYKDNPLVTGAPNIRFYAGAPLVVDGHALGTLCIIDTKPRDCFDERQQQQLRHIANAVEAAIRSRQKQLQTIDSNSAKTEFLSHVSHEIRTPLNAITSTARLMQRHADSLPADCADLLQTLSTASDNLHQLVDAVLDLSAIEARSFELNEQPTDLAQVLEQARSISAPRATEKGIALHLDATDLPAQQHLTDPLRLRQVLVNLVGNAIKFTDQGSVTLRAALSPDQSDLVFEVEDTGIGIAEDKLGMIFRRFWQSQPANQYGGAGLGLAICQQLIGQMGGQIEVASTIGKGTRFTVTLPFTPVEKTATPEAEHPAPPQPLSATEGLHILVAEDVPANSAVLAAALEHFGCTYQLVTDGQQALEALPTQRFDMILMDVNMPHMTGIEATTRIRAAGQDWSDIPIIGLSAHAFQAEIDNCLNAGMDDYLSKPLNFDLLREKLARTGPAKRSEGIHRVVNS